MLLDRAAAPPSNSVDVVIVGAGLAGLEAARRLAALGRTAVVLEARDRVGGRTLSHRLPSGEVVDLGAQWIGPGQDRMAALVAELGLHPLPQACDGKEVLALSGGGLLRLSTIRGGAQQTRLREGFQEASHRLADQSPAPVLLEAPVRRIRQDEAGVTVEHARGEARGRFAIVAVPPALAGRIEYGPPLPAARDQLTQRVPMGSVIKCVAVHNRPFWRARGYSGEAVCDRDPVRLAFDDSPEGGAHGALVAFVLADAARRAGAAPAEARAPLRRGGAAPLAYVEQDWSAEPWSRGCYAGLMPPGVLTEYGAALRAPVGRVHWAGTETAARLMGYMEGALESGQRAAQEIASRSAAAGVRVDR